MSHPPSTAEALTWDPEAEADLVGAVLGASDFEGGRFVAFALAELQRMPADAFSSVALAATWEAMARLAERGEVVDYRTVGAELRRLGRFEEAGGDRGLAKLLVGLPPDRIPAYARIVREAAADRDRAAQLHLTRKRAEVWGRRLQQAAADPSADVVAALEEARDNLAALDLREASSEAGTFQTLAELLERPELLAPPECTVPRMAWRGRLVIVAGPDKCGKSTLVAHASAALTRGVRFLGEEVGTRTGRVVQVGLEEAVGDAVQRFRALGADPSRVQLLVLRSSDLLAEIRKLLSAWPADLVVIDSLTEWARTTAGEVPGDGDNAGWANVVRPLVALAREQDVAVLVIHHVRRQDGEYRGASEIAASADVLLEIARPKGAEDPSIRHLTGRGRWPVEPFDIALRGDRYELATSAELSVDARILLYVEQNPGCTQREVREAVTGKVQAIAQAIRNLVGRGALENRGSEDRMVLYAPARKVA